MIPSKALDPNTGYFMEIDEQWIDVSRIARWPATCDLDHEGICHTFPPWKTLEHPPVLILIDVEEWRLAIIREPVAYVALSYVWGRIADILETTVANFESLQQRGTLASSNLSGRLPKTVHDAIVLTRAMGQRYIWIDRLCIIQDDYENKKAQLDSMASIYARSYFTIVAVDGSDADYGLRGVPGTSSRRSCKQKMYHFFTKCTMMQAPLPEESHRIKDWHRRGWTFQERTLSNRNLVFFQDQVFWECRSSVWIEDIADAPEGANPLRISKRKQAGDPNELQFLRYPDLRQYANLVHRYNSRLLSFHSDALNAFSAILQVLHRSFPGNFIHGLPEFFFDYALLWQPVFPGKKRDYKCPSWSWLSLEGDIVFMYYNKADHVVFNNGIGGLMIDSGIEIFPMVGWFITTKTGAKHRISNSHIPYQNMRKQNAVQAILPPGWSQHTHKQSNSRLRSDQETVTYFQHPSVPDKRFIYPVPLISDDVAYSKPAPDPDFWSTQLHFTTSRRFLTAGPVITGHIESGGQGWSNYSNAEAAGCLSFNLLDEQGNWVGFVRSNTSSEQDLPLGELCEIIVLSAGSVREDSWQSARSRFMELMVREELREVQVYGFFNVMWIERGQEGVAVRKGVGRVWKVAWERERGERVDVVLE